MADRKIAYTLGRGWAYIWTYGNPCDKDFRIVDLPEPLRQRFQIFYLSEPLRQRFQNFDLSEPLRQRFQNFDLSAPLRQRFPDFQTPPPAAAPEEFSDPNLTPLPTHPGIKYVARALAAI